jgi:hypothetical protein
MPLLFALVGVVALLLAALVLVAPVLLVVGIAKAIRAASYSHRRTPLEPTRARLLEESPLDARLTESAFADLISREWPTEASIINRRTSTDPWA